MNDISKTTILVLLVLVIVVSLINTWLILYVTSGIDTGLQPQSHLQHQSSQNTGVVSLIISKPQSPPPSSTTGKVSLSITKQKKAKNGENTTVLIH